MHLLLLCYLISMKRFELYIFKNCVTINYEINMSALLMAWRSTRAYLRSVRAWLQHVHCTFILYNGRSLKVVSTPCAARIGLLYNQTTLSHSRTVFKTIAGVAAIWPRPNVNFSLKKHPHQLSNVKRALVTLRCCNRCNINVAVTHLRLGRGTVIYVKL